MIDKGKGLGTCYRAAYMSQAHVLYHLGISSWLAWANDTAAHYAAIHCLRQRTVQPAAGFRHPGTYPKKPGGFFFGYTHL